LAAAAGYCVASATSYSAVRAIVPIPYCHSGYFSGTNRIQPYVFFKSGLYQFIIDVILMFGTGKITYS
jgi:hypothetical protein